MVKVYALILSSLLSFNIYAQQIGDTQTGKLQYYNDIYHGRPTASGEIYDKTKVSAAHKTLPMKTMVEVINLENNKSIFVEINDRTPEGSESVLELSRAAAEQLDFISEGETKGKIRIIQVLNPSNYNIKPSKRANKIDIRKIRDKGTKSTRIINSAIHTQDDQPSSDSKNIETSSTDQLSIDDAIKIGNDKFAIQLGAYGEKSSLQAAIEKANSHGIYLKHNLFIITENTKNGTLYKLIYGYFGEDLAKEKVKSIQNHFNDLFIKKF